MEALARGEFNLRGLQNKTPARPSGGKDQRANLAPAEAAASAWSYQESRAYLSLLLDSLGQARHRRGLET